MGGVVSFREDIQFVVGRPKGSDTTAVASVLFDVARWTAERARRWLSEHGFRSSKLDRTAERLRFRQRPPSDFEEGSFRTIEAGRRDNAIACRAIYVDDAGVSRQEEVDASALPDALGDALAWLVEPDGSDVGGYATLRGVEIFRAGTWNGDRYTVEDLDEIVENFGRTGFDVPVKLGHREESGGPAYGWVSSLRRRGDRLVADFRDLPEAIHAAIKARRFGHVSAEIFWNLKRAGRTFRRALKAVALLGAETPAVSDLAPLREAFTADELRLVRTYIDTDREDPDMSGKADDARKDDDARGADEALAKKDAEIKALQDALAKAEADRDDGDATALEVKRLTERLATMETEVTAAREREREARISEAARRVAIPALREHFVSLYRLAFAEDAPKTVRFTTRSSEGKVVERDQSPEEIVDDLVARLNRAAGGLFSVSPDGDAAPGHPDDRAADARARGDDPGRELDRLARAYMSEKPGVGYADALTAVLANPDNVALKHAYARASH